MLKKNHRLKTKDINFLLKKKNIVFGKYFSFIHFSQYPNKHYNQFSVQIGVKFHKSSVRRNFVRRAMYQYIYQNSLVPSKINGKYLKIFVITNKDTNSFLQKMVEKDEKKHIKEQITNMMDISFKAFCTKHEINNKAGKEISGKYKEAK